MVDDHNFQECASISKEKKKGFSFRDLSKLYKSVFAIRSWRCHKKSPFNESQIHSNSLEEPNFQGPGKENHQHDKRSIMNGFGQLELHGLRGHYGAPTRTSSCNKDSSKHRSMDTFFSSVNPCPVPRTTSKRSPSPSPSPNPNPISSFANRNGSFRSVDNSTPKGILFPETLSRSSSRWSSNPIMFSNSTGTVKPPPVERKLECTLEDLCYGCTKKIKITRDVLTESGQIVEEEEILSIKVKPGWKKGTKITFEGMGNERPGCYAADVTFVIAEKRHNMFRREGDDLELAIEIPLVKALTGCTIPIPLLGGETMNMKMDDIIHPGYEKIIAGQGMPNSKEGSRGNLKVLFLINFPTQLADEQRQEAVRILEGSC